MEFKELLKINNHLEIELDGAEGGAFWITISDDVIIKLTLEESNQIKEFIAYWESQRKA